MISGMLHTHCCTCNNSVDWGEGEKEERVKLYRWRMHGVISGMLHTHCCTCNSSVDWGEGEKEERVKL